MSKISDIYGGKYLTAENVPTTPQEFEIIAVGENKQIGKVCLELDSTGRELALNKTNATAIAEVLGDDTDLWPGGLVTIRRGKVMYQGKRVDSVQVCGVRKSRDDQQSGAKLTDFSNQS